MSKSTFIIISNKEAGGYSVVKDIADTMATATTFKKAYSIACFLSDIKDPNISYRVALKHFNDKGHVYIKAKGDDANVTSALISTIKQY